MADTTTNIGGHVARLVELAEGPAEPEPKQPWRRLWGPHSTAMN